MVLINWLCAVGGTLKIVKVTLADVPQPIEKIKTRTVELKDLVAEIQGEEVKSLARRPEELEVSYGKVFEAAGIKPSPHGWTIDRLCEVLRSDALQSKDREAVQKALILQLAEQKVSAEDLVKDATARDQALDAFEDVARRKMNSRSEDRQRQLGQIQSQIESLQEQASQLQQEQAADQQHWKAWHDRKIEFEKEMAWAIGYLLDRPVITIDNDHG